MSTSTDQSTADGKATLRILALHGSEGTASEFPNRLESLKTALAKDHNIQLEISVVEGPFRKGEGYSWWTMPPGIRSFTAEEYGGFDEAAVRVVDTWKNHDPPFDLCLGHSQGAVMLASLMTLNQVPYHPRLGYVFNGVSFPNPYREAIKSMSTASPARVLFVMGTNDKVTPNETGEELRDAFEEVGIAVETIKHAGGHAIPNGQGDIIRAIIAWILNEGKGARPI